MKKLKLIQLTVLEVILHDEVKDDIHKKVGSLIIKIAFPEKIRKCI